MKILIAEEFIIAYHLKLSLENLGHSAIILPDCSKLVDKIRQDDFDLLLIDVYFSDGSDCIEIVEEIRSFSDIPVIYLASDSREVIINRAQKTDPVAFLPKPVTFEEVLSLIE